MSSYIFMWDSLQHTIKWKDAAGLFSHTPGFGCFLAGLLVSIELPRLKTSWELGMDSIV